MSKVNKNETKKKSEKVSKPKKEKSIFHHRSEAGKGDRPRVSISLAEWGKKWDEIFKEEK
jgi:hypothetical protein